MLKFCQSCLYSCAVGWSALTVRSCCCAGSQSARLTWVRFIHWFGGVSWFSSGMGPMPSVWAPIRRIKSNGVIRAGAEVFAIMSQNRLMVDCSCFAVHSHLLGYPICCITFKLPPACFSVMGLPILTLKFQLLWQWGKSVIPPRYDSYVVANSFTLLRPPWHCNPSVLLLHIHQWDESKQVDSWLTNRWPCTHQVGVIVCWISWESECWHSCVDGREFQASLNGTEATPICWFIVRHRYHVCRFREFFLERTLWSLLRMLADEIRD